MTTSDAATWPREGERWEPCLPWPEDGPPDSYDVSSWPEDGPPDSYDVSSHLGDYYVYAPVGDDGSVAIVRARTRAAGSVAAWEHRYGEAEMVLGGEVYADASAARRGCAAVLVEVVGGEHVFVTRSNGARFAIAVRDLRRGFRRVEGGRP